jgi:hypothetical protein
MDLCSGASLAADGIHARSRIARLERRRHEWSGIRSSSKSRFIPLESPRNARKPHRPLRERHSDNPRRAPAGIAFRQRPRTPRLASGMSSNDDRVMLGHGAA